MTTRKKFLAAALVLAGLVAAVFLLPSRKSVPVFDGDLKPIRKTIADQDNAFHWLTNAAAALYWPADKHLELVGLSSGENWNKDFAEEILFKNREALTLFERAMACAEFQVPAPKDPGESHLYLVEWRHFSFLASIHAAKLFRDGKEQEALGLALQIVHFGQRAENSGGQLLQYAVGSAVKQTGLQQVRQIAWESTLPPSQLMACLTNLETCRANALGLTNTLKNEYHFTTKMFEDLRSGIYSGTNSSLMEMAGAAGSSMTFDLDKTKNLLAQNTRVLLRSIPQHLGEMRLSEITARSANPSMFNLLLRGNATGELLVGMLSSAWTSIPTIKCRENSAVSATQLSLALKCFYPKHGHLPENLSELVPDFLPAIPLDDFDGKPLRYSRERHLIWSVGKDLIDSGGVNSAQSGGPDDILFEIELKTASRP